MTLKTLLLAFVPMFVAVDAIGAVPLYMAFTEGIPQEQKRRIIVISVITALFLALSFVLLGQWIFRFLGITVADFMIAGGSILFVLAITDLLTLTKTRRQPDPGVGAVPIGTPLIAGPATLTMALITLHSYGTIPTVISVTVNIILAGVLFAGSDLLLKLITTTGAKVLSKIANLFLAAIAVMMIRRGITILLQTHLGTLS
jgi:multiple antibiotic resistance protein